jgi:hypothetical protein
MHYSNGIEAWGLKRRYSLLYYFRESPLLQFYVPVAARMKRKFVRIGYVFSGIDFRLALLQHFAVFAQTFLYLLVVGTAGLQCANKRFIHCKVIWRYVTGLPKCADTKHLLSVDLITSLLFSRTWKLWLVTSRMCRRRYDCRIGPIHTMRHVSVPSPFHLRSVRKVVFTHLPEQRVRGDLRLFPSCMQPTATECVFRYLLIIGTSVMIEWQ